jgi:bilirubin oxidase
MGHASPIPLVLAAWTALIGVPLSATAAHHETHPARADTLRNPPVLTNHSRAARRVEVSLTAVRLRASLTAGSTSEVFAYNGQIPGPTLELREGDHVTVHFRNDLPEQTTVHWHGLNLPFESDGSPFHPVEPGETRDYVFTVRPGSAGTYWYHPHPHHRTGYQVAKGLAGAIIIRAADDPLPATLTEKLLILSDTRLNPDGSIDLPDQGTHAGLVDRENGREGELLFVNGQVLPTLRIRPGEVQRWRILNASASRVYRLALTGHTMTHVGSDGGLFDRPVEVGEIVLASAERAEVLVRGTGTPGGTVQLQALPYDRYIPQTRPSGWNRARPLLTLEYATGPAAVAPRIPDRLREIPVLDTSRATATRVISLSQGLINGREMDMARIDVSATLGATEIWEIENLVGMDHPFHLHGFQFQVIDRDGVPEPFRSWKDTVNVPKHQTVRFIVRYENYPGKWMFHCHILDHEDHGMMGILEVR